MYPPFHPAHHLRGPSFSRAATGTSMANDIASRLNAAEGRLSDAAVGLASAFGKAMPLYQQAFALDTTWFNAPLALQSIFFNNGGTYRRQRDSVGAFLETRRARLTVGEALDLDHAAAVLASPEQEFRAAMAWFAVDSSRTYYAM